MMAVRVTTDPSASPASALRRRRRAALARRAARAGRRGAGDGVYRRTLRLPGGAGGRGARAARRPRARTLRARRCGRPRRRGRRAAAHLLDLDADPAAHAAVLAADPALAPLVAANPGLRAPGTRRPAPRPRCARCSASRSRSPPPARSPAGSSRRAARRCPSATARSTQPSRRRRRSTRDVLGMPESRARAADAAGAVRPAGRGRPRPRPGRGPAQCGRSCSRSRASGRGRPTTSCSARSAIPTPSRPATSASVAPPAPSASPTTRRPRRPAPSTGGPAAATPRTISGPPGMRLAHVATPIGTLTLVATDDGLRGSCSPARRRRRGADAGPDPALDAAAQQLGEWFAGARTAFDLPLDLGHATPFQRRAWLALAEIPYARTRSYGEQARASARRGPPARSARRTGATRCRSSCRATGSSARGVADRLGGGLDVKRALLAHEPRPPRARRRLAALARVRPAPRRHELDDLRAAFGHGSPPRRCTRNSSWNAPRRRRRGGSRRSSRRPPRAPRAARRGRRRRGVVLIARRASRPGAAGGSARGKRLVGVDVADAGDPACVLLELLGEHHDDAARAADVGQLVDVLVGRDATQRVAAVPRGDLEGLVDVVDREGDPVHADLVGQRGLRLDRVGVDVLEELEATVAVRGLEHRDVGVVAVEADGGVGPLAADRVAAEDGQPEVGEEGDRRLEVADGDADVLELDGHASHATPSIVCADEQCPPPTAVCVRRFLVGAGGAVVGLLPWLATGARLPLQNLAETSPPP